MVETCPRVDYWDLAPSLIREPFREAGKSVPVSILGDPGGDVVFQSAHPDIAQVEDGHLRYGSVPGATVITAESFRDGQTRSLRHIQVDIERVAQAGDLEWQPSGYVDQLPGGIWHFHYFTGWYDEDGSNIQVTGELSATTHLDRDYLLRFDIWGEIESVDGPWFDVLELHVDGVFIKQFNPTEDLDGDPLQPYPIPRRTETIDLSDFTGGDVVLRFMWDTGDNLYQRFDGWFVSDIGLIPMGGA